MSTKKDSTKQCKTLLQRMHAVMQDVKCVPKTEKSAKKTNGLPYSYVSHDAVTKSIRRALVDHGIVLVPSITDTKRAGNHCIVEMSLTLYNVDDRDDNLSFIFYGEGVDNQDKGLGKAYSYAYKYALLKIFSLETGNIDDVEAHDIDATSAASEKLTIDQQQKILAVIGNRKDVLDTITNRYGGLDNIDKSKYEVLFSWCSQQVNSGVLS